MARAMRSSLGIAASSPNNASCKPCNPSHAILGKPDDIGGRTVVPAQSLTLKSLRSCVGPFDGAGGAVEGGEVGSAGSREDGDAYEAEGKG